MSSRMFQGVIQQMRETIGRVIGVMDENGVIVACSDMMKNGEMRQRVREELAYMVDVIMVDGYTYRPIGTNTTKWEFVVFVEGEDKEADKLSTILSVSFTNIKSLYDEKYDKSSFIKNIILDNILPSDIYLKSKELHFSTEELRVVFLIKFQNTTDTLPYDMLLPQFPDKNREYIISIGDQDLILVKEVKPTQSVQDIEQIAEQIAVTLNTDFFAKVIIGIGRTVDNIKDLARSYKEAQMALEVGRVFDAEKTIVSYENLGIGRLIYQIPTTMCEMFLQEVFKHGSFETLDRETLQTIQCFFDNNLNVSETSRKLFVHRNTLVYRLEKIRKLTGLDLREFDHAITFKVALMVKRYLSTKGQ